MGAAATVVVSGVVVAVVVELEDDAAPHPAAAMDRMMTAAVLETIGLFAMLQSRTRSAADTFPAVYPRPRCTLPS